MKKKLLATDGLAPEGQKILEQNADLFDIEICQGLTPEQLLEKVATADALVVRSATKVTSKILEAAKNLKIIGRAGIGIDNVDLPASTSRGVIVMNTPDENATTTAEHAIALLMAAARQIPQANKSLWDGKWDRKTFVGTELSGKTAGVIGLGNIGKLVAKRLQGLKLNTIAYDPFVTPEVAEKMNVKMVSLDELLKTSDIITLHVPLIDKTKNLLDDAAFSKMKKGVILVNCARGGIVSETALLAALENKTVKSVGTDVFEQEPPDPKHPLLFHPNVVATPHLGAQTTEAQKNVSIGIAQQMVAYFRNGEIKNALNFPNLNAEEAKRMVPYTKLGEHLGKFLAQWNTSGADTLEITYEGDICDLDCRSVNNSIVKGFLTSAHPERVNYVNAMTVAKDSGLTVKETKTKTSERFTSEVTVTAVSKGTKTTVSGTLFGKEPRLVRLNDLSFEAPFSNYMLCVENEDKPGVVGAFGTLLGTKKINIENMQLALRSGTQRALSIISVSTPVSPDVLKEIEKLNFVVSAKCISA